MRTLLLSLITISYALQPIYDCVTPCNYNIENTLKQVFVFNTQLGQSKTFIAYQTSPPPPLSAPPPAPDESQTSPPPPPQSDDSEPSAPPAPSDDSEPPAPPEESEPPAPPEESELSPPPFPPDQVDGNDNRRHLSENSISYSIVFAQNYNSSDVTLLINDTVVSLMYTNSINAYFQLNEYEVISSEFMSLSSLNITVIAHTTDIKWLIRIGNEEDLSLREILLYPVNLVLFHGYFWSGRFYDWVFFVVNTVLVLIYISSSRCGYPVITALSLFSLGSFLASFCAKLYHLIVASIYDWQEMSFVYSLCVVCFCFDILPCIFIYLHLKFCRRRPFFIASLNSAISIGFLFLGGGYYLGSIFLFMSSCSLLIRHILLRFF